MKKEMYKKIEKYMLECMTDGAHDSQHIYRVLYSALDIARESIADKDILITACLLHDVGRNAQFENPNLDHALVGADMAYSYLLNIGWSETKARHVKECISTHRFRNNNSPESIEAKILYDADKLDVTGTMGIARTLEYKGIVSEPLYHVDNEGNVLEDQKPSFFHEYHWKLKNVYNKFFTNHAKELAAKRQKAGADFYDNMFNEVQSIHQIGTKLLNDELE